jgi:hypothetical protein
MTKWAGVSMSKLGPGCRRYFTQEPEIEGRELPALAVGDKVRLEYGSGMRVTAEVGEDEAVLRAGSGDFEIMERRPGQGPDVVRSATTVIDWVVLVKRYRRRRLPAAWMT